MQQITVDIPDNKVHFFLELIKNLGFGEIRNNKHNLRLTEEQLKLVEIEKEKIETEPEHFVYMHEALKNLNLDA